VKVLHNRCPHKGAHHDDTLRAIREFSFPYHAWTFRTDAPLFFIPLGRDTKTPDLRRAYASGGSVRPPYGISGSSLQS